jgi:hypothetical protein
MASFLPLHKMNVMKYCVELLSLLIHTFSLVRTSFQMFISIHPMLLHVESTIEHEACVGPHFRTGKMEVRKVHRLRIRVELPFAKVKQTWMPCSILQRRQRTNGLCSHSSYWSV